MHPSRKNPLAPVVLIADDEESVLRLLERSLERQGLSVLLARDGQEAVELFHAHQQQIRVVLLDVLMPRLDGPMALAQMVQAQPAVVSCFMTGYAANYDEQELLQLGAQRVFLKPFLLPDVLRTLLELCPAGARCA